MIVKSNCDLSLAVDYGRLILSQMFGDSLISVRYILPRDTRDELGCRDNLIARSIIKQASMDSRLWRGDYSEPVYAMVEKKSSDWGNSPTIGFHLVDLGTIRALSSFFQQQNYSPNELEIAVWADDKYLSRKEEALFALKNRIMRS